MMRSLCGRLAPIALTVLALGADDPAQTVKVRGVTFAVPASWKRVESNSSMRAAQFKVAPVDGDTDSAEMILYVFPGGGGTVRANLDRWQAQFEGKDGKPPEIMTETRKGKTGKVTFAEAAGRYVAAVMPGRPEKYDKPGYRLLGAIAQNSESGYYFKMVGPDKTMKAAKPAFDAMIESIALDD